MFNLGSYLLATSLLLSLSTLSADGGVKRTSVDKSVSYVNDTNKFGKEIFTIKSDKSSITAFITEVKIKKDTREIITTFVFDDGIVRVGATILKTETGMTKFDFKGLELLRAYIDNKPDLNTAIIEFDLNSYTANLKLKIIRLETQAVLRSGKSPAEIFTELESLNEKYIRNPADWEKVEVAGISCLVAEAVYGLSLLTGDKDNIRYALCRMMVICYDD